MVPIPCYDSEAMGQEKVALRKLAEEEAGKIISDVLEKVLGSKTIWVEMRRMWIGESVLYKYTRVFHIIVLSSQTNVFTMVTTFPDYLGQK